MKSKTRKAARVSRRSPFRCSAAKVRRLVALLREADRLLVGHHDSTLCTWWGVCPVCSKKHTESYPHDIFGRIESELKPFPPNAEAHASATEGRR